MDEQYHAEKGGNVGDALVDTGLTVGRAMLGFVWILTWSCSGSVFWTNIWTCFE